jgi:general secretion pathway protein L
VSRRITLRLLADDRIEWIDVQGTVRGGWPPADPDTHVTVLVPGEAVTLLELPRVAATDRQLTQALPALVEEQLVAPVEMQHLAWWPAGAGDRLCVAAVLRTDMENWLARLRAAGLEPDVLLPDTLALPWQDNRPLLLVEAERFVLRLGEARALAGSPGELPGFIAALGLDPVAGLGIWTVAEAPVPWPPRRTIEHALHAFASAEHAPAVNLLQGDHSPRRRTRRLDSSWRWAIGLVALALLTLLLTPLVERQLLAGAVAQQRAEMQALARRVLPAGRPITDPARQLQAALGAHGLGQGDGALDLLTRVAPAIAADPRLATDSLSYRRPRLEVVVQADDMAGLDALRGRLTRAGLTAEIASSTPGTQGVQGRLRIGDVP